MMKLSKEKIKDYIASFSLKETQERLKILNNEQIKNYIPSITTPVEFIRSWLPARISPLPDEFKFMDEIDDEDWKGYLKYLFRKYRGNKLTRKEIAKWNKIFPPKKMKAYEKYCASEETWDDDEIVQGLLGVPYSDLKEEMDKPMKELHKKFGLKCEEFKFTSK